MTADARPEHLLPDDLRAKHLRNAYAANAAPCPRCLALAMADQLRLECVLPLFAGALAPRAVDGSGPCCIDCGAADLVVKMLDRNAFKRRQVMTRVRLHPRLRHERAFANLDAGFTFEMARIAVGNDRQESLRLLGAPLGLIYEGWMRASQPGELTLHHAWMNRVGLVMPEELIEA